MLDKIKIKKEDIKNEITLFADSVMKEYGLKSDYDLAKINKLLNNINSHIKDIELEITNYIKKENEVEK